MISTQKENYSVSKSNFGLELFEGNIPKKVGITIYGENEGFSTTTETISPQGGRYVFPSTAGTLTVVSDSAEDSQTGTGIRRLVIRGLDDNYEAINEVVLTDGLTPVATVTEFFRVNEVNVEVSGSNNGAVGNIDVLYGTDILARIVPEHNISTQGVFTVPAGTTVWAGQIEGTAGKDDEGKMHFYVTNPVNDIPVVQFGTFFYENSFLFNSQSRIRIPEKHDVEMTCTKTGAAGAAKLSVWVNLILQVD